MITRTMKAAQVAALTVLICGCSSDPNPQPREQDSAAAKTFIQRSCDARVIVQTKVNELGGLPNLAVVPYLEAVGQHAADGLDSFPESDDLQALRDWSADFAGQIGEKGLLPPTGKKEIDRSISLAQRVAKICDEFSPSVDYAPVE